MATTASRVRSAPAPTSVRAMARAASSAAGTDPGVVTAVTRRRTRSPTGSVVASVTADQCSGCTHRWSPSAAELPSTASRRWRAGPGVPRAAVTGPRSAGSRPTDSMNRTRPSSAPSGSGTSASAAASPSASMCSRVRMRSASAGSSSRLLARAGSANPSRAMATGIDPGARELTAGRRSQARQVALELEGRHLVAVVVPLGPLVAQEELEGVLAEGLGDELAALHDGDRLVQAGGQRLDAHRLALGVGQAPDVVLGLRREVVALLDALQPRGQQYRERE